TTAMSKAIVSVTELMGQHFGEAGCQKRPLARVVRKIERSAIFRRRLAEPAETAQEVGAGGRQEVIRAERRDVGRAERVGPRQRALGETDRHRAIELYDRRWRDLGERTIVLDDRRPVGGVPRRRAGMTRGDGSLELIATRAVHRPRAGEQRET